MTGSVSALVAGVQLPSSRCFKFVSVRGCFAGSLCGAAKKAGKLTACPLHDELSACDSGGQTVFDFAKRVLAEVDVFSDEEGGATERAALGGVFGDRHQALFHVTVLGALHQPG